MTFTFDLLTSNLVRIIHCRVGNLRTNFGISGTFCSWLMANTCQKDHMTLRPWPLTLEVMALVGDTDLHAPSVYKDCTYQFGGYDTLFVS